MSLNTDKLNGVNMSQLTATSSETQPEERRQCDRCGKSVTAEEWAHCNHSNCRAFYASMPEVLPNAEGTQP